MTPKNSICLWYDRDALEAAEFYAATFPDTRITAVRRAPAGPPGPRAGALAPRTAGATVPARAGPVAAAAARRGAVAAAGAATSPVIAAPGLPARTALAARVATAGPGAGRATGAASAARVGGVGSRHEGTSLSGWEQGSETTKTPACAAGAFARASSAASYSPRASRPKYHRRWRA